MQLLSVGPRIGRARWPLAREVAQVVSPTARAASERELQGKLVEAAAAPSGLDLICRIRRPIENPSLLVTDWSGWLKRLLAVVH